MYLFANAGRAVAALVKIAYKCNWIINQQHRIVGAVVGGGPTYAFAHLETSAVTVPRMLIAYRTKIKIKVCKISLLHNWTYDFSRACLCQMVGAGLKW